MNFNYDLITWLDYFVGSFACCFGMFLTGKILLQIKFKEIKIYNYLLLVLFSFCIIFNSLIFDNIVKIFGTLVILFIMVKVIFKQNYFNSFLYSIAVYIFFIFGESTVSILIAIIDYIFKINVLVGFVKSIFINIVISILSCLYSNYFKLKVKKIVNQINKDSIIYIFILGVITIFMLISTMYKLYLNKWVVDYIFILNTVIFGSGLILTIVLLRQFISNKEITDKYVLLQDYLKTSAELIEKYSITVHKYKNNLIAIKGYLSNDMLEAEKYIDNLIDNYSNKKYAWFRKINFIQIDAIRYVIYYKLSKAETENLKILVDVSSDIKKYKNNTLNVKQNNILLDIIGELFDNAIFASKESKEKELNFVLYEDNKYLNFIISNTFDGEIDLNMIIKNGYTTKGKGHGLGLYDIEKVIKKNNWIDIKYELEGKYFIVKLQVKK